jgi:hypothetical protein
MAKYDPLELKNEADAALERAASRLRSVLQEAVAHLDPFPPFPGAFFSYGIEIDARRRPPDVGCVILGQDGDLYELKMGQDVPALEMEIADPSPPPGELKPLDLHPRTTWCSATTRSSR